MKLKFEISVDADVDTVWAAYTNPDNLKRWVQNCQSVTPLSGVPGEPGSTAEIVFDENGKTVVLKETITERREKAFLAGTYESPHGTTLIVNNFDRIDDHSTRWTAWSNASFSGVMKILSVFIANKIRKRTEDDMARFKLMVESDQASKQ